MAEQDAQIMDINITKEELVQQLRENGRLYFRLTDEERTQQPGCWYVSG